MSDWQHLAEELIRARVRLGYPKRSRFAADKGLTNDRTLADLENARRENYDQSTRALVEQIYGLAPGNFAELLQGLPPRYVGGDDDDAEVLMDLPEEALRGLSAIEQEEVRAAARLAALAKAREIRGS